MATPKKKVSKSRRNMRRFSPVYKLDAITLTVNEAGEKVRPHRVASKAAVSGYLATRAARKAARQSAPATQK